MRLLATLLALVSAALLPLALTAAWAERTVTDTTAYVDAVGPLADDPAVRDAVATRLTGVAEEQVAASLGPVVGSAAADVTSRASRAVVGSDAFARAWRDANAELHAQLTTALEGERSDELVLRLDPLVDEVLATLARDLRLPAPPEVDAPLPLRVASAQDADRAREAYRLVDAASPALPVVWAAVLVLALLPRGRRATLVTAAAASVVTCLLLWLAVRAGGTVAAEEVGSRSFVLGEQVARLVYDEVTSGLRAWAVVASVVAAVVLVLAALAPRRRRRSARG
ncbi:hypothetical protein [Nocardioides perillae]|uniref:Integral membrane protein n=1 Tax=Nocardioides perillae TaxID=1119534 RepID=A0A7Y9RPC8_9ACTN|nr:hypothetical protein [Nocardioides perillae]NYG54097.1 hypothetical protein [Nocardioides perillae]